MSDSSIPVIPERNMSGKAIKNTYLGILRVGNNITLNVNDNFLTPEYYASSDTEWTGAGINSTHDFLSGAQLRFVTYNDYTELKLPVTDSMGNFLNFSLGETSALIGTESISGSLLDNTEQFTDSDTNSLAALNSQTYIKVGLSDNVKVSEKDIVGGTLKIENSSNDAQIITVNKQYHNGDNGIKDIASDEYHRTIISTNGNPAKWDAFIFDQENIVASTKNNKKYKDCYIKQENVLDYILDKVSQYVEYNTKVIPSGTIISQYCDLKKWFCITSEEKSDDWFDWQGYRPAMIFTKEPSYSVDNLIQGKALSTTSYLYYGGSNKNNLTTELPPDFKRGYVLCNGDSLSMQLYPSNAQDKESERLSLSLFFNLFYMIGYYYNASDNLPKLRKVKLDSQKNGIFIDNELTTYNNIDRDIAYTNAMAIILAFKVLDDKFNTTNIGEELNTLNETLMWLSNQSIPDEYIFNSVSSSHESDYYLYSSPSLKNTKLKIDIGKEINNFNQEIPYYIYNESTNSWQLINCPIYKMAEVRDMAKLFVERKTDVDSWKNYNYHFNVPKLYTSTDSSVNLGSAYEKYELKGTKVPSTPPQVTIGQFIGSNGLLLADEYTNKCTNVTVNLEKDSKPFESNYVMKVGYQPHSHAIAKGKTTFNGTSVSTKLSYVPEKIDNSKTRISNLKRPTITNKNRVGPLTNENIITADYRSSLYGNNTASKMNADLQDNYILQDVSEATLLESYNKFNGFGSYEYSISGNSAYKWYGRTSEPLWYNEDLGTQYTNKFTEGNSTQGYFRPESIKLLPLIKL